MYSFVYVTFFTIAIIRSDHNDKEMHNFKKKVNKYLYSFDFIWKRFKLNCNLNLHHICCYIWISYFKKSKYFKWSIFVSVLKLEYLLDYRNNTIGISLFYLLVLCNYISKFIYWIFEYTAFEIHSEVLGCLYNYLKYNTIIIKLPHWHLMGLKWAISPTKNMPFFYLN